MLAQCALVSIVLHAFLCMVCFRTKFQTSLVASLQDFNMLNNLTFPSVSANLCNVSLSLPSTDFVLRACSDTVFKLEVLMDEESISQVVRVTVNNK